ncbi:MAG: 50S ribosomal protein L18a [Methanobrevibacter sp.]|jgi:large subunit ribosomal protein LX|nr:50S ribosomal protein L18a [Candidatus Methanovirga basalitermitum]
MKTRIYRVNGEFVLGEETQVFTKELKAVNEKDIYEKIYSEFGSKHRIKKKMIRIDEVKEISKDEVVDTLIKTMI